MVFKYAGDLQRLECELNGFSERDGRDAFCWTFDPITDDRNFIPRAKITGNDRCGSWALSFFETEQQAKKKMKKLMAKNANLYLKLGTHIAYGKLNRENGISENCNSDGHFNHHEYADNNFKKTFLTVTLSYK